MKLIKTKDKFILVSDEEIKEGDKVYFNGTPSGIVQVGEKYKAGINGSHGEFYMPYDKDTSKSYFAKSCIKIISEYPDFSLLSEEDCKKIGWVDVEKLALEEIINMSKKQFLALGPLANIGEGYILGFKKAQSLNDKMFSLDDMENLAKHITNNYKINSWANELYSTGEHKNFKKIVNDYLNQSLQQTEWDVEVEMEEKCNSWCKDCRAFDWSYCKNKYKPKITNNSIKVLKIQSK